MNHIIAKKALAILGILTIAGAALAQRSLPAGTDVKLAFDQHVSSKTAKSGDRIKMHVAEDVSVNGKVLIKQGTAATGVISDVKKRGRWGKNAKLQITVNPLRVGKTMVPLQPRNEGKEFKGSKTDKAAIATGAGAVILGPIGLVGGYFIPGKSVEIKPGDTIVTQVSRTTHVH